LPLRVLAKWREPSGNALEFGIDDALIILWKLRKATELFA